MGGFSARKALSVVRHTETVVAIEILAACQGETLVKRSSVSNLIHHSTQQIFTFDAALEYFRPLKSTPALEAVYSLVRTKVPKLESDRHMAPDIDAVTDLVRSGEIVRAVVSCMNNDVGELWK